MTGISDIWIEAENWASGDWNLHDDNSDVIVTFINGRRWVATFFTYQNILSLAEKNKRTGECLDGAYLWASDMVLVDELSRTRIESVIEHLVNVDEFELVFTLIKE